VLGVFGDVVALVSAAGGGGVLLGCISSLSDSSDDMLYKSRRKYEYSLVVSFFSLATLF
jgi:hypothetical protein